MAQNDLDPNSENYGGYRGDNDVLYPAAALGVPSASEYSHVPPGAPVHHEQVSVQPSNLLDFVTAGSPDEVFHNLPAQFFNAFQVRKRRVIVPRVVNIPAGGSGLVLMGETDVFGLAVSMADADIAVFRDGIDLSGQPVMPVAVGANANFGMPGVRFFNGIYADFTKVTTFNFTPVIFTAQEFPEK